MTAETQRGPPALQDEVPVVPPPACQPRPDGLPGRSAATFYGLVGMLPRSSSALKINPYICARTDATRVCLLHLMRMHSTPLYQPSTLPPPCGLLLRTCMALALS